MLRDGRKLIGVLRSVDQFANLVLEHTVERIFVGEQYGDVTLGLYIVRGENVVLVGELVRITINHVPSLLPPPPSHVRSLVRISSYVCVC